MPFCPSMLRVSPSMLRGTHLIRRLRGPLSERRGRGFADAHPFYVVQGIISMQVEQNLKERGLDHV